MSDIVWVSDGSRWRMHSRSAESADLVLIRAPGWVGGVGLPSRSAGEMCLVVGDLEIVLQHVLAAARGGRTAGALAVWF